MTVSQDTHADTLAELRAAYRAQLDQIRAERDEARRQARRARAEAVNARADLAGLQDRVRELLQAVAAQLDTAHQRSQQFQLEQPRAGRVPDEVLEGRVLKGAPEGE
ncbi:hypothetical protein GCM10009678_29740 [Actinomadura kijaniata]|uniref:Uncharacterized coiled-coil DUF342 family protein n=1 Tax=Actinomadura namibiensis TaxID=182080 RepID=A0A7W3LK15_ACTNM|nr:hypothetical protein [Actinomadura namibiensis]MBA8949576.1 uncharacterized coiled-coil DUF342 family protein [Actinomadura namibiensis]